MWTASDEQTWQEYCEYENCIDQILEMTMILFGLKPTIWTDELAPIS